MKYLPDINAQEFSTKIDKIEKKLDDFIVLTNKQNKVLREELMKCIAQLREEIVVMNKKFDNERQILREKKAKVIAQFESE